eukprot:GFUD01003404.1.p1 GENE.GFUD01003404.1~~GFUD01003404.1.p1  ORF type:complete len:411 (-),score=156.57 GFUD01003404.1:59-1291(-)
MGNILSFFFPEPAPASLEQVVVEVSEDVVKTMEATKQPADPVAVDDFKHEDLVVEQKFEVIDESSGGVSTKQKDEEFEVIEEDHIDEVSNVLKGAEDDVRLEELLGAKQASLDPAGVEIDESIKDSEIEAQEAGTLESVNASSIVADYSVVQEKETVLTEVETIGSIQDTDSDVELVEETISEPIVEAPSEPTKCLTPEPHLAYTAEDKPGPEPTPEQFKVSEPVKAPTPEPLSTPEPILSTSEPAEIEMPTLEPILVTSPEPLNSSAPEPINTPSPILMDAELTSEAFVEVKYDTDKENIMTEVEMIGSIQDSDVDLVDEIISELIMETPKSNIEPPPKPTKSPTPDSERPYSPIEEAEPTCDQIPDPIKTNSPESLKAGTPEPTLEMAVGAAGLKDVLQSSSDLNPAI